MASTKKQTQREQSADRVRQVMAQSQERVRHAIEREQEKAIAEVLATDPKYVEQVKEVEQAKRSLQIMRQNCKKQVRSVRTRQEKVVQAQQNKAKAEAVEREQASVVAQLEQELEEIKQEHAKKLGLTVNDLVAAFSANR